MSGSLRTHLVHAEVVQKTPSHLRTHAVHAEVVHENPRDLRTHAVWVEVVHSLIPVAGSRRRRPVVVSYNRGAA